MRHHLPKRSIFPRGSDGSRLKRRCRIALYPLGLTAILLCVVCSSSARFSSAPPISGNTRSPADGKEKKADPARYDGIAAVKPTGEKATERESSRDSSLLRSPRKATASFSQTGVASYYARKFHGRRTASGERYNMRALTAAHPHLPFGTRIRVTNLSNNRSVVVRVNDRGPHTKKRVVDLSLAAAEKIGLVRAGVGRVTVEALD